MASTRRPSQAERGASNAWRRANGGCIFADARNAVTSAAATAHQISTRRSTVPLRGIRSSRVSSRARSGFTTIVPKKCSKARSFMLLTRIRWIKQCPDRPKRCRQTGNRCSTSNGFLVFAHGAACAVKAGELGYLVTLGFALSVSGSAGENDTVSQVFHPDGRCTASNS
jgi:hypothetical protein